MSNKEKFFWFQYLCENNAGYFSLRLAVCENQ